MNTMTRYFYSLFTEWCGQHKSMIVPVVFEEEHGGSGGVLGRRRLEVRRVFIIIC